MLAGSEYRGSLMPANGCPCGSQLKAGLAWVGFIDDEFINAIAPAIDITQWAPLLGALIGQPVTWGETCQLPPPAPPTPSIEWITDPFAALSALLQLIHSVGWNTMCECLDCPPIVDCTGAGHWAVDWDSGQETDPVNGIWEYFLQGPADYYFRVYSGTCYHSGNGLHVIWHRDAGFDPNLGVAVRTIDEVPIVSWNADIHPSSIEVYANGSSGPPTYTWPDPPVLVDPVDASPACTETAICDTLGWVAQHVQEIQYVAVDTALRLADQTIGLVSIYDTLQTVRTAVLDTLGVISPTIPYSLTLPGLAGPVGGNLADLVVAGIKLVLPATPAQLAYVDQTSVTDYGSIDVGDMYAILLELTTVPAWIGQHDLAAPVYYTSARAPGPGWATMSGPNGVVERKAIVEATGQYWMLPSLADTFTYDLQPGVTLSVTRYRRDIS